MISKGPQEYRRVTQLKLFFNDICLSLIETSVHEIFQTYYHLKMILNLKYDRQNHRLNTLASYSESEHI